MIEGRGGEDAGASPPARKKPKSVALLRSGSPTRTTSMAFADASFMWYMLLRLGGHGSIAVAVMETTNPASDVTLKRID